MRRGWIWIVACGVMVGCQSTTVTLQPAEDQQRFYTDGAVSVASKGEAAIVMVAAQSGDIPNGQRLTLALRVENLSESPFDIDTSNISVVSNAEKPLKVHSYDDLVREEKQERVAALVITAIAGGVSAYSAAQNASTVHTYGNYQSNTNGPYGNYSTSGNFSGTVHDPLRGQIAANLVAGQTSAQMNSIAGQSDAELAALQATILKRTTVFPGMASGGSFVFDAPPLKQNEIRTYRVSVRVDDETHTFDLTQQWKTN